MLLAPDRCISSWVITKIAAAASERFCSFLDTEVTWMFIKSSSGICERSLCAGDGDGVFDAGGETCPSALAVKISEPRNNRAPLHVARACEAIARLDVDTFSSLNRRSMFQTNLDAIAHAYITEN
jgi:hypothetical protein